MSELAAMLDTSITAFCLEPCETERSEADVCLDAASTRNRRPMLHCSLVVPLRSEKD